MWFEENTKILKFSLVFASKPRTYNNKKEDEKNIVFCCWIDKKLALNNNNYAKRHTQIWQKQTEISEKNLQSICVFCTFAEPKQTESTEENRKKKRMKYTQILSC